MGVPLEDLNRSWAVVVKGARHAKNKRQATWLSPSVGLLKLNFDGSFVQPNQGGIGGVIRDCSGNVLRSFSGPVYCLDANEAKVYALLVGCCELRSMGGCKAITEGDSFSAIQWGSGKIPYPWRLANWVEEV